MFHNNRKTIAIFSCNSHGEYQREICTGAAIQAEKLGYNLAILEIMDRVLFMRREKKTFFHCRIMMSFRV